MADFELLQYSNLISRKILSDRKIHEISTLWKCTYTILNRTPIPLVISMIVASISYSLVISLSTAIYTNIPVTTQMSKTDTVAPMTSARCQPKFIDVDEGLEATYSENRDIMKEAKSVNKCAASVAMAKLLAKIPPTISRIMKNRHKTAG